MADNDKMHVLIGQSPNRLGSSTPRAFTYEPTRKVPN